MTATDSASSTDFIRSIITEDQDRGKYDGRVVP